MAGETGTISREYALSRAEKLREIAKDMDVNNSYPKGGDDQAESEAQILRQAAFVIEMTAPKPDTK